jgi:hypothetical protein
MPDTKQLKKLTDAIEKLIANPVLPVAPVAPVAPVLPIVQTNTGDHDLLQRLDTKVDLIQSDITELKKQNTVYVNQTEHNEVVKIQVDHEQRIRNLETSNTRILTWGSMAIIAVGILETVLTIYFKK